MKIELSSFRNSLPQIADLKESAKQCVKKYTPQSIKDTIHFVKGQSLSAPQLDWASNNRERLQNLAIKASFCALMGLEKLARVSIALSGTYTYKRSIQLDYQQLKLEINHLEHWTDKGETVVKFAVKSLAKTVVLAAYLSAWVYAGSVLSAACGAGATAKVLASTLPTLPQKIASPVLSFWSKNVAIASLVSIGSFMSYGFVKNHVPFIRRKIKNMDLENDSMKQKESNLEISLGGVQDQIKVLSQQSQREKELLERRLEKEKTARESLQESIKIREASFNQQLNEERQERQELERKVQNMMEQFQSLQNRLEDKREQNPLSHGKEGCVRYSSEKISRRKSWISSFIRKRSFPVKRIRN